MSSTIDPSIFTGDNYKPDVNGDKVSSMVLTKTDDATGSIAINGKCFDGMTMSDWCNIFSIIGWDPLFASVTFGVKTSSHQTLTRKETTNVLRYLNYVKTGILRNRREGCNGFA